MTISVLKSPRSFDKFTLDGSISPGDCVIASGGGKKVEIVDQGQPLTTGKNTIVRSIENVVVTYGFKLYSQADIDQRDAWIAMLLAGTLTRPVRVYKIVDNNALWIKRVCFEAFNPQTPLAPGGPYDWSITLHEYNKVKPFGGPLKPPVTGNAIADATKARDSALNALNAAVAAQAAARRAHEKANGGA